MSKVHLYSAYCSTNDPPFRFEISEVKIKRICEDMIETEYPYFISNSYSTRYFGGATRHKLDVEYHLNFGCVYYSTDKEKCMKWLENKYKQTRDKIINLYNAISESQIIDKGVEIL